MEPLTPVQSKALEYIRSQVGRSGCAPTLREICSYMGYSAIGSAQDIVTALRRKGYLEESDKQSARSLILTRRARNQQKTPYDGDADTFVIPCLGAVPAGDPIEAIEDRIATLRMSVTMFKNPLPRPEDLFALRASGDSMIGAGIFDGDWLVVSSKADAPSGSIVVARMDGDATVKRLLRSKKSGWYLQPENPKYQPILASETPFEVIGQVLALQRSLAS